MSSEHEDGRKRYPLVATLVIIEIVLIILSWMLSASHPELEIKSIISEQSARYFLGRYASLMATPVLACLVFIAMTYGSVRYSGILKARHGQAIYISIASLIVFCTLYALMSFPQHGILRSATGVLLSSSSPFTRSLIPILCIIISLTSIIYGTLSGRFLTLSDACKSLFKGISDASPLFLYYILVTQIYYTVLYMWD